MVSLHGFVQMALVGNKGAESQIPQCNISRSIWFPLVMAESLKWKIVPSAPTCLSFIFLPLQYSKHLFVHIGQTNPSYSDPLLEAVDIRQIYDKFPEKKGGLKELYERGPQNSFFLVKFWVRTMLAENNQCL